MSETRTIADTTSPSSEKKDRRQRHTIEERQSAYDLFVQGKGYKYVSRVLNIPKYTVRDWKRLYVQGRFYVDRRLKLQQERAAQAARYRAQQEAIEDLQKQRAASSHWEN